MASRLIKNSLIYAIGDIIPKLLGFVSFPIYTTYLSPAEYGIINYVNTINLFLTALGFLCLNTYYLIFYYKQKTEKDRRRLLGNLSIFVLGINLILSVILLLVGPKVVNAIESNISFYPYIAIGIVTNFFSLFAILPSALYRLEEKPLPLTVLNVAKGIIVFGLTIVLIINFGFKADGILYSQMVVTMIFALIFAYITVRNMEFCIDWKQLKVALIFSIPLLPGAISYLITSMFDRILIDRYLNLKDLGIYSSASSLALILNIVSYGAYKAFEPYIFKIYESPGFKERFIKLKDGFFLVMLITAFGISLFAKDFFLIFSEQQYHIAYFYVPIILIGILFSALYMPYGTVLVARGRTTTNSIITICGGIVSISLNIWLLPRLGLIAAGISSALTYFIILAANIFFSGIKTPFTRSILVALSLSTITYIVVYTLSFSGLLSSILTKIMVFIAATLMSIHIIGFSPADIKAILLHKNIQKIE